MKKLAGFALFLLVFAGISFAQQAASSNLYHFRSEQDADIVLKVLNEQLKISETDFPKVRDLLNASAISQKGLFERKDNQTPENVSVIVTRQTMHIEANLKAIIGDEKYKLYLQLKPTIEEKVKKLEKL